MTEAEAAVTLAIGPRPDRDPDAIALVCPGATPCDYGAMWDTHARAARALQEWTEAAGGAPRILGLLPDRPSTALAVLSLTGGAAVAPVNPALAQVEVEAFAARLSPATVLVRADRAEDRARAEALGLPVALLRERVGAHCADFDLELPAPPGPSAGRDRPGLVLSTSGSTGNPKLVPLTTEQMMRSAANIASWLRLGPTDRALHMLPMFHVGAFVDLLLAPLLSGGSVHFGHPITTERLVRAIADERATWIQLVPTMLHHLLEHGDAGLARAASRLRFVRTVSADLAPTLQKRAHDLFGDVPVIQMYGMTETAGQITSNPLPPEVAKPGSVGRAAGPEVVVLDPHANPRPPGGVGEVCVRGPTVMSGYLDHDGGDVFHGPWFRTGDLGYVDEDGYLTLTGRRKQMINRGGEKIAPVEIERVLLSHPDVLEAAAFAVDHPSLGEEPAVAVVAVPGRTPSVDGLQEHVRTQLAEYKRPRRIAVLDGLPRLGSGKIDRTGLRASVATGGAGPNDRPTIATSRGRTLSRLWSRTLGTEAPRADTDFFDVGGDSLAAATFVERVEKTLGVVLPANALYESPTFGELQATVAALPRERAHDAVDPLVRAVRRATAGWAGLRSGPHDLLVGRRTMGDDVPFFFVTPGVTGAEELLGAFHPERPIYVMRTLSKLRSRFGRRLKNDANNRTLAALYRDAIEAVQPTGPVLLGGFCQGADVARLVAEALRASGREVALLALIDRLFREPVRGRAAVVWTAGSSHSGNTQFAEPERRLGLLYPDGCDLLHSSADHTWALQGEPAQRIAAFFERAFADALEGGRPSVRPTPDGRAAFDARRRAHAARIRVDAPRLAAPGASLPVRARVTNRSSRTWAPTAESGLHLCARWLNLDGHPRTQRSASAPLERAVAPGETVTVELSVPFPEKRLPMLLLADMVDDGLVWFHWVGSRPGYRLVLPAPLTRRTGSASNQR